MRYFDYQNTSSMGKIWELFSELGSLSKNEKMGYSRPAEYGHTLEIIRSAVNRNLPLAEDFSLLLYERKCSLHEMFEKNEKASEFLAIVDSVGGEDDRIQYGEISSNTLSSKVDPYRELEDKDEFERCLKELYTIRGYYQIQQGIDPVETLRNSLKGVPEATTSLITLVSNDIKLREIISFLCENGSNILQERLEGSLI